MSSAHWTTCCEARACRRVPGESRPQLAASRDRPRRRARRPLRMEQPWSQRRVRRRRLPAARGVRRVRVHGRRAVSVRPRHPRDPRDPERRHRADAEPSRHAARVFGECRSATRTAAPRPARCGRGRSRPTSSARSSSAIVSSDPGRAKKVRRGCSSPSTLSAKDEPGPLTLRVQLEMCGMVTALAALRDDGAGRRRARRRRPGEPWPRPQRMASVHPAGPSRWTSIRRFFSGTARSCGRPAASASASAIDDYDWEALRGGGFAALDPTDGRVVVRGRFSDDLAWGNGGVAVALVPGALCGIGRRGQVYTFDTRDGTPLDGKRCHCGLVARHRACRGAGRSGALRLQSRRVPAARDAGRDVASDPYSLRL